jgi:transcriptional regulator GlxA family with amidase domain
VDGSHQAHHPVMSKRIEIVVFDGFDEMDAIAPYEVFRTAAGYGAPIDAELVGAHGAATITASHGTRIVVDRGPSESADVVLVPGGGYFHGAGIRAELERGELPDVLVAAHARGAIVGSVCTGAMLLAATGLTAGRRATTHHLAMDDLRASGAEVVEARFVDDGDIVTAGGVTSGLDLALHLVERFAGSDVADRVAAEVEYERSAIAP